MAKAINFKNWCIENISPQAWSRIVLKSIPEIRTNGLDFNDLDNPSEEFEINDDVMKSLNQSLDDLYHMKIEAEVLN